MQTDLWARAGVSALITSLAAAHTACSQPPPAPRSLTTTSATTQPNRPNELPRQYHVKIEPLAHALYGKYLPFIGLDATPPTPEQARDYRPLAVSELMRYPPAFLDYIRLKRVVICDMVVLSDTGSVHGIAALRQNAIYIMGGNGPPQAHDWRSGVLHHELSHFLDERGGHAYDAQWQSLNPKEFRYGPDPRDRAVSYPQRGGPGFLTVGCRADVGQDKAEFFAYMVTDYAAVRDLGRRDPIVNAKANLMERMVHELCPAIDAAFWADARRRSEDDRLAAAEREGWTEQADRKVTAHVEVEAGIDPLEPNKRPTKPFALVRLTRFPNARQFAGKPGRMTHVGISWHELLTWLYWLPAPRCVAPPAIAQAQFDVIVSLPDVKTDYDPRLQELARTAFETQFGVKTRKETREVDVYLLKLGAQGTKLLDAAARPLQTRPSRKPGSIWEGLTGRKSELEPGPDTMEVGGDFRDGKIYFAIKNAGLSLALGNLEDSGLDRPVIDETGFGKRINVAVPYDFTADKATTLKALADALGLDLVPARRSVELTIFEAAPTTRP